MKTINPLLTRELVTLGYQGKNEYKRGAFNISDWIRTEARDDILLFFKRPSATVPYPCNVESSGNTVNWTITAVEANIAGIGETLSRSIV